MNARTRTATNLIVALGLFSTAHVRAETPVEVEGWDEFKKAPKTDLELVPRPKQWAPPRKVKATMEFFQKGEKTMREIARKFSLRLTSDLKWNDGQDPTDLYHWGKNGEVVAVSYHGHNRVLTSVQFKGQPQFEEVETKVTSELFKQYALETYQKVFDEEPTGKLEFKWEHAAGDASRLKEELVSWVVSVEGVRMKRMAWILVQRDASDRWTVSCYRGPTKSEVKAMEKVLKEKPVLLSRNEALAIGWKNWKAVRSKDYEKGDFEISSELLEVSQEELRVWNGEWFGRLEGQAWKNTKVNPDKSDRVFYDVRITDGLFTASVLVNRTDGSVFLLRQGRVRW